MIFKQSIKIHKVLYRAAHPKPKNKSFPPILKPLQSYLYIISHYGSSPLGTLRLETISSLCKIAPLPSSHPLPTLLPTHYECFTFFNYLFKKYHKITPSALIASSLISLLIFLHKNQKNQDYALNRREPIHFKS